MLLESACTHDAPVRDCADIEELTRKTGNYKRFPIFVNMLLSAMAHRSDAVFVDLLTTSDLVRSDCAKTGRQI